ncbi:MAG: hypothetical protein HFF14_05685 [Angelakisella sp.]|jgi:hypothetical protein|nr:hypothetical protein [Angelakisella sp.]
MSQQSEKLESMALSVNNCEVLADVCQTPTIEFFHAILKSSVPFLGSVEAAASKIYQLYYQKKMNTLLEAISTASASEIPLEDLLKSKAIGEWHLICEAIKKINSAQKIRTLGILYKNTYLNKSIPTEEDDNLFEEWVSILSDMSDREISILLTLYRYENSYSGDFESKYVIADFFWKEFSEEIIDQYHITEEEFYSILTRLLRTGFYRNDFATAGQLDRVNKIGYTTEYFKRFLQKAGGPFDRSSAGQGMV